MSLIDTPLVGALSRALDVASTRQSVVTENIANVDTPGYRTREVDFRAELGRALADDANEAPPPLTREVPGLMERPDGNNVNIDRESMMLSEAQLQYQLGVQLVKSEFHTLLTAIKE